MATEHCRVAMQVCDIIGNPKGIGCFRPLTLRNVELTAPYMHDAGIVTFIINLMFSDPFD